MKTDFREFRLTPEELMDVVHGRIEEACQSLEELPKAIESVLGQPAEKLQQDLGSLLNGRLAHANENLWRAFHLLQELNRPQRRDISDTIAVVE